MILSNCKIAATSLATAVPVTYSEPSKGPSASVWISRTAQLAGEPSVSEMLDDPIIEAVMIRDGIKRHDILRLFAQLRPRLVA